MRTSQVFCSILLLALASTGVWGQGTKANPPQAKCVLRDARLFCSVSSDGIQAPQLALDNDRLAATAKESGQVSNLNSAQKPLLYQVFMTETGAIVEVRQVRGPKIAAVEAELARTRVVTPGRRGLEPIPVFFYVEVAVP